MTETIEHREERRREPRSPAAGRVRWNNLRRPGGYAAWLSDRAESSVAFIMSTATVPLMDDEIELTGPNAPTGRLRIARIAPYDDALSLVAAQHVSTNR